MVCRPKSQRGLALGKLVERNVALMTKWLWRFPPESDLLWHVVNKSKYGLQGNGRDS